jgi:N-acetylmuramoyl-L-alanine amidase
MLAKNYQRILRLVSLSAVVLAIVLFVGISLSNTREPVGIIIHHSAIPPLPNGQEINAGVIDEIHRERGFRVFYWGRFYNIGYHYVILPDGTVQQGRPEHCQGAHAPGYNSYIGICLVGDFSHADNPNGEKGPQEPTEAQMRALIDLTQRLRERYHFPVQEVRQHVDVNPNTECPGDRFPFHRLIESLK